MKDKHRRSERGTEDEKIATLGNNIYSVDYGEASVTPVIYELHRFITRRFMYG